MLLAITVSSASIQSTMTSATPRCDGKTIWKRGWLPPMTVIVDLR